jgi:glycosyltransferase involved in cell wall biosynthesis
MRICLFTPNFLPAIGGAERMADALARGLIARGHEVQVLAQRSDRGEAEVSYPVHRYRRPPAMHRWPGSIGRALCRLHRRWPFQIVLAFYAYPTGYAAARVKDRLGVRLVVSTRGGDLYPTSHLHGKPGARRAIVAGYRGADRIVSISAWMTRRLHEVVGAGLPAIAWIPNGIDLAGHDRLLAGARAHRPTFAARLGEGPVVLPLATLTPVKRHAVAIEAIAAARATFEGTGGRYVIAGDGPCRAELEARVNAAGVRHLVHFVGFAKGLDKYALLNRATMMVSTSMAEGMPNVLLEAMASGVPGLVSDIDPHVELTEAAPWARTFALDDAADLARGFEAMLGSDLAPMRQAARQQATRYTLERLIDRYEAVCLGEHPAI